jgi:hypothetical protein
MRSPIAILMVLAGIAVVIASGVIKDADWELTKRSEKEALDTGTIAGFVLGSLLIVVGLAWAITAEVSKARSTTSSDSHNDASLDLQTKKCPGCAEYIKLEACKCRYCGQVFEAKDMLIEIDQRREQMLRPCITVDGKEYISLQGDKMDERGFAFCLGCRQTVHISELYYHPESDSYYHKQCIPKA